MLRASAGAIAVLVAAHLAPALALGSRPPAQPIPFSHRLHAGVNRIGCLMCHVYARHSPVAGIPALARCAGCPKFVDRDKPAVQQVLQAYQQEKVIEWARVYTLPDHVFFTHERHLAAGLECQRCHGPVQQMDVLRRASPLLMGWCLDCHDTRKAPTDCLVCHK